MTELKNSRTFALLESEFYTWREIFAKEYERIFTRVVLRVPPVSAARRRAHYVRIPFAGEEIVVVRGEGDRIHAHLNVCRHRGFRLCDEPAGKVRGGFVCGYHQWRYGLDGACAGVPQMKDGEYFDFEDYGLQTAHVEVWRGWTWSSSTCPPGEVEPIGDQFKSYEPVATKYTPERTAIVHEKHYEVAANWKVAAENSLRAPPLPGRPRDALQGRGRGRLQADLREWLVRGRRATPSTA